MKRCVSVRVVTQSTNNLRIDSCRRNPTLRGASNPEERRMFWSGTIGRAWGTFDALPHAFGCKVDRLKTRPSSSTTSTEHDFRFPRRPAASLFHERCPDIALKRQRNRHRRRVHDRAGYLDGGPCCAEGDVAI